MTTLIQFAGLGQLGLVVASLAIPRALSWSEETARLRPIVRELFWVYAGYIWATNLAFGLVSALAPGWLIDHSPLAGAVTSFMTLYWGARVAIQFLVFDRSDFPPGARYRLAEAALVGLFCYLTAVYGLAAAGNLGGWTM